MRVEKKNFEKHHRKHSIIFVSLFFDIGIMYYIQSQNVKIVE